MYINGTRLVKTVRVSYVDSVTRDQHVHTCSPTRSYNVRYIDAMIENNVEPNQSLDDAHVDLQLHFPQFK